MYLFLATLGLQYCTWAFSSCSARASLCGGFSCGALALLPYGMWVLPRPGIKPVSPALQDRFLTNGPPGKPREQIFF